MVNLKQYKEINDLNLEDFNGLTDYKIQVVSIFYDLDPEDVNDFAISKVKEMYQFIDNWYQKHNNYTKDFIEVNGIIYEKMPFNNMTLGEFIDAEFYFFNDVFSLIPLFYRIKEKVEHNQGDKFEPYGNFINVRKELFMDVKAEDVMGLIKQYQEFRGHIINSNSDKFVSKPEEDDKEAEKLMTKSELKEYHNELRKEKERQKYSWERLVMDLCNNDITKFNDVLSLPVIMVFNIINMLSISNK